MVKVIERFNSEVFNHLIEHKPFIRNFVDEVNVTERCRICAKCQFMGKDFKCSLSDCKFYTNILFNRLGVCPKKRW